jgi:Abortive infection C-terminus
MISRSDELPKLFKMVTSNLPFLPAQASSATEVRQSLTQTLNGLHTAVQGIRELRNRCGFASHGSGAPRPAMESVQALLAAEAADAIVGFLIRVHQQDRTPPPSLRVV